MTATEIAGFAGAGLAGAAYVPQISHLVRARCSAGISRLAFTAWLLASVLTTARAIAIGAAVFITLGGIQIVATTLIVLCAARYQGTPCPRHPPVRPGSRRAPLARDGCAGLPQSVKAIAGHCGSPAPALPDRARAADAPGLKTTLLKETT
jgi:PQ loop repeat